MMDDTLKKYNRLDKAGKKKIKNLIDFLLSKRKKTKNLSAYKEKILDVSQWSEKEIEQIQKTMRSWKPKEW